MKTEHRYLWRVIDRGRPSVTPSHLTVAEVRRDYPECTPEPIIESLQVHHIPETADEILEVIACMPSPYGPGKS